MIEKNFTRTAAILYADQAQTINPNIIKRKFIESIFIDNNNKNLNIDDIALNISEKHNIVFSEEEILEIINSSKKGYFLIKQNHEIEKIKIRLSDERFSKIQAKVSNNNIDNYIEIFSNEIYDGQLNPDELSGLIHEFIYLTTTTNINELSKIITNKISEDNLYHHTPHFGDQQRYAINQFLSWDNNDKNRALFVLISYSIEYCLIVNNTDISTIFDSLSDKIFYLDNNIIYRALGINGENRKKRILSFLCRCKQNKQKLRITKYTYLEFLRSLKHQIKQLQNFPYAKINPHVFQIFNLNTKIYEMYFEWREETLLTGHDLFLSYIENLFFDFVKNFDVELEEDTPFDELDEQHDKNIKEYITQIKKIKGSGNGGITETDAKNIYLIETVRKNRNKTLADTQFYMISSDQRLRSWDYTRSENQPIVLLPSQWMSLLLRYGNRTNSDYKAYVSFLKLSNNKNIIKEEQLGLVITGITNITENFKNQEIIAERMIELKFDQILENRQPDEIIDDAASFSEKVVDNRITELETEYEQKIVEYLSKQKVEIDELNEKNKLKVEHEKTILEQKKQIEHLESTLKLKTEVWAKLNNQFNTIENNSSKRFQNFKKIILALFSLYYILIILATIKFNWNLMEPILYLIPLLFGFLFVWTKEQSFSIPNYLKEKRQKYKEREFEKFSFDVEYFNEISESIKSIEAEILSLKDKPGSIGISSGKVESLPT